MDTKKCTEGLLEYERPMLKDLFLENVAIGTGTSPLADGDGLDQEEEIDE